jgi:predicted PurR-regulated permease PerM
MKQNLSKPFLIILLVLSLVASFLILKPYITEILVAAVLVSIFYGVYERLVKFFRGKKNISALIMCILLVLLIIIPVVNLIAYTGQKSITAYHDTVTFLNQDNLHKITEGTVFERFDVFGLDINSFKDFAIDTINKSSDILVNGAAVVIKETSKFLFSLTMIILAMFFFFVDGKNILKKAMYLSPLPNRYDKEIFKKFRAVSYTTFISTFVTAAAQGLIGALGFIIIGLPAFFAGILMGFLSLLPYIGSAFIYVPVGIYLIVTGSVWKGIFILEIFCLAIRRLDRCWPYIRASNP